MRASTLIFLLLIALTNRQAIAQESILNIYNWSDYRDPQIIDDFEKLYDIEVNYDIYDTSEMVDTKLMTGSSGATSLFIPLASPRVCLPLVCLRLSIEANLKTGTTLIPR